VEHTVRGVWQFHLDECLMHVELVFIRGPRAADASSFDTTLQLTEEAKEVAKMHVGVEHIPLQ
jgi:hypothetical protein